MRAGVYARATSQDDLHLRGHDAVHDGAGVQQIHVVRQDSERIRWIVLPDRVLRKP